MSAERANNAHSRNSVTLKREEAISPVNSSPPFKQADEIMKIEESAGESQQSVPKEEVAPYME